MRRGLTLFAVLMAAAAAAVAQVPVASVNGVKISSEALDRRFDEHLRARNMNIARLQRPDRVREMKRAALDELIHEELLWQQAQRENRIASDDDVERALAQAVERAGSRERFLNGIARQGFDEAGYRRHVRRMLSADLAAQRLVDGRVQVPDAEVEAFYRANAQTFEQPERVLVREIMLHVPRDADAEARNAARQRMQAVATQLAAGADFAELARRYSQHPTRQWGGAHDPVARGQLAPALDDVAFALRPGQTSGIVETADGLHLLRVDERRPAQTVPLEAVRERIREHLLATRGRQALERELAALRARSRVEILVPL
ncbi:MAG: peptidylprolyl isomerase [Betaproteobacteria bacterium]|nr:MAG: peptidylprolyl isomerase [Betaproteobacteria bacterium]